MLNLFLETLKLKKTEFIVDWDNIMKGRILCYIIVIVSVWDMFQVFVVYQIADYLQLSAANRIDKNGAMTAFYAAVSVILLSIFAIMLGGFFEKKSKLAQWSYMCACMLIYTASSVMYCYLAGIISLAAGVMMAAPIIIGWILFSNRAVAINAVFAAVCSIPIYFLALFGVIDYAPIVEDSSNLHTNLSYNALMMATIVPHLFALLALAYVSISDWKAREARTQNLANVDSLTHIPNRRQLDVLFQDVIRKSVKDQVPTSIMMFDMDNFKAINDGYSRHLGDDILKQSIGIVLTSLRPFDIMGRLGGDEFMVIMPNTDGIAAQEMAQMCCNLLHRTPLTFNENTQVNVTACFGVYTLDQIQSLDDVQMLKDMSYVQVEKALLEAKSRGYNQVFFS